MNIARLTVISPGALAAHPLRGEKGELRAPHATTTLVEARDRRILVDPSLPPDYLLPRLAERAGIGADAVTDVFLTDVRGVRRRGLAAFPGARVWASEQELEVSRGWLGEKLEECSEAGDEETADAVRSEIHALERVDVLDDSLAPGADIFPLPGVTAGLCGLLVSTAGGAVVIAGDAVPTAEHMEQGVVLTPAYDVKQAQQSLRECLEEADAIVAGRDGLLLNPMRGPMARAGRNPMMPFGGQ